jgi:citrate lyase beta subunit
MLTRDLTIQTLLNTLDFRGADIAVRINPLKTALAEADIEAIFSNETKPTTIVVPKVETQEELTWLFDKVEHVWDTLPDPDEMVNVLVQIESVWWCRVVLRGDHSPPPEMQNLPIFILHCKT